jgi:glycosyltransferase involved in cell wall biosynthesis
MTRSESPRKRAARCAHTQGGFGVQKQFAIEQCTQPWILVLDADERIPPDTAAPSGRSSRGRKEKKIRRDTRPQAQLFPGRWIRHNGWWPDRILRLFRRGVGA